MDDGSGDRDGAILVVVTIIATVACVAALATVLLTSM